MKLSWQRQTLHPKHKFATSQGVSEKRVTIVLRLEHDGIEGMGEIIPSELYGQTLDSAEETLNAAREFLGDDPFVIEPIVQRLIDRFDGQRATIDGIDAALHDWCGKKLEIPVWRLLGLSAPKKQTTFTIGIADTDEIREKVDEALAAGFDALKIKVGAPNDHETLTYIRSVFKGPLFLDANQAWKPEEAPRRIVELARFQPTVIEQPLDRADWQHMVDLRRFKVAPIIADESCERPADVNRLNGFVDGINIKLNKCGGICEARRMITLARGFGMTVMLGCFVSSSLAIAPALTIASLVDHADLDGALLLADDPFAGITRTGSTLQLSDRPGLGVWPVSL